MSLLYTILTLALLGNDALAEAPQANADGNESAWSWTLLKIIS